MNYKVDTGFLINCGFIVTGTNIHQAINQTNYSLASLPHTLFNSIDYKTTSAMVGSLLCGNIASIVGALVNPIEKGHPDIIPLDAEFSTEEELRNYPEGLEIKCTVGNVTKGANLRAGQQRLNDLVGITWQAHHREVTALMGVVWDFCNVHNHFVFPAITAVFYSNNLEEADWGAISGTTGRNTKVSGMNKSGREKMRQGLIAIVDNDHYQLRYSILV